CVGGRKPGACSSRVRVSSAVCIDRTPGSVCPRGSVSRDQCSAHSRHDPEDDHVSEEDGPASPPPEGGSPPLCTFGGDCASARPPATPRGSTHGRRIVLRRERTRGMSLRNVDLLRDV